MDSQYLYFILQVFACQDISKMVYFPYEPLHGTRSPVSRNSCGAGEIFCGCRSIDKTGICPYIKDVIARLHWAGQHATLVHRKAGIYPAIFLSGEECALKENLERLYR